MGQLTLLGAGKPPAVAGGATTTLDPSNKAATITLSGGNLVASVTTASANGDLARAVASQSSGKYYCEGTLTAMPSSDSGGLALMNSSAVVTNNALNTANALAYLSDGHVYFNGGSATIATFAQGNVIGMAVDIGNQRLWFRVGAGNWNNNGANDPATNTGGIDISAMSTAYYPGVYLYEAGSTSTITMNFGGTAYGNSAPSGFGNW